MFNLLLFQRIHHIEFITLFLFGVFISMYSSLSIQFVFDNHYCKRFPDIVSNSGDGVMSFIARGLWGGKAASELTIGHYTEVPKMDLEILKIIDFPLVFQGF